MCFPGRKKCGKRKPWWWWRWEGRQLALGSYKTLLVNFAFAGIFVFLKVSLSKMLNSELGGKACVAISHLSGREQSVSISQSEVLLCVIAFGCFSP